MGKRRTPPPPPVPRRGVPEAERDQKAGPMADRRTRRRRQRGQAKRKAVDEEDR